MALESNRIFDLLLTFSSSVDQTENADWNMTLLEIFFLIFKDYDCVDIMTPKPKSEAIVRVRNNVGHLCSL